MRFKPIRLIPDDTKIHFMRMSRFGFFISGILCAISIALFAFSGLNYGVDFKGGTDIAIRTSEIAQLDNLRTAIDQLDFGKAHIQEYGSPYDVLIRLPIAPGGDRGQGEMIAKVKQALGPSVEYRAIDSVSPSVSEDLTQQGMIAVVTALICISFYIWFRFEWQFAVGAIMSLLHDLLLTIGLFCLLGIEFNLQIIAAILTIVGYSLNDTVVVFDRFRDYLRKYKQMHFADLIDLSLNSVLPRTILTSLTTLLALLALYFFGGEVLRGFTFTMIWGVVIGTYSSIFIAAPILILLGATGKSEKSASQKRKAEASARP